MSVQATTSAGGGVSRLQPRIHPVTRPSLVLLAAVALLLALIAPAAAAPPTTFDYLVMRSIYNQGGQRGTVVAAEIPASTPLPAEVRLNVPKGAQVAWVGEVLGGDPSQDPKAAYRTIAGKDYDTLVLTMTKGRRAQVEFALPNSETQTSGLTTVRLGLVAPGDAKAAAVEIEVPTGATVSGASTGTAKIGSENGYDLYGRQLTNVRKGDKVDVSVGFQPPSGASPQGGAQQPVAQAPASPTPSSFPPLPALVFVAVLVFVTVSVLKRMRADAARESSAPDHHDKHGGPEHASGKKTKPRVSDEHA